MSDSPVRVRKGYKSDEVTLTFSVNRMDSPDFQVKISKEANVFKLYTMMDVLLITNHLMSRNESYEIIVGRNVLSRKVDKRMSLKKAGVINNGHFLVQITRNQDAMYGVGKPY
jgi:hypothetical protein